MRSWFDARFHDQGGMTLVELLMAIVMLAFVLMALASSLVASLNAVQKNERQVRATQLANEVLENLQALDYFEAGLYESEGTAHWGGAAFEGEDLVLLPDVATRDPDVPLPEEPVTRGGIEFTVQRAITWQDDPDPSAPGTEDYKRFVVLLTWEHKGETHTFRSEALRAPSPDEGILRTSIVEAPSADGDGIIALEPVPPSASTEPHGRNAEAFIFEAFTKIPVQSVKVEFLQRGASSSTTVALAHDGDNQTWDSTINDPGAHRFANGEALFEFTATEFDGTVHTAIGRALFLHPLDFDQITVGTTPDRTVDAAGDPCFTELTLNVHVFGVVVSDTVDSEWSPGPGAETVASKEATESGATFENVYTDVSTFEFPPHDEGEVEEGDTVSTTLTLSAVRAADGATVSTTQTETFDRVQECSS